jgi:glutamate 5-kinase
LATLDHSIASAKRLVVKIGSALLVDRDTGLRTQWLKSLAADVAAIRARGTDVILVSSGSIALGRGVLGLSAGDLPLEQSQAAASVGQIRLARAYDDSLAPHGITTGQVLVTLEDSEDRRRYLNSRATMETLLSLGVTPIVNENDTVATDEIRYGDNDRLAAQVAVTAGADCLVLLSDVDGLYTDNPQVNSAAQHYDIVEQITPEIEGQAGDAASGLSKGGMKTKIIAAKLATDAGCAMVITLGTPLNPLKTLEDGGRCTWFIAQTNPQAARKRWIAAMKPQAQITIDTGAQTALASGKSLLPIGMTKTQGVYLRGDPVAIMSIEGVQLGVGLTRYSSVEADLIKGLRSQDIAKTLGYEGRSVFIHRDDMVI